MSLHSLRPQDRFNVIVFNSDVQQFANSVQPATTDQIERALAFVKQSRLRGGTNLGLALERAQAQVGDNSLCRALYRWRGDPGHDSKRPAGFRVQRAMEPACGRTTSADVYFRRRR